MKNARAIEIALRNLIKQKLKEAWDELNFDKQKIASSLVRKLQSKLRQKQKQVLGKLSALNQLKNQKQKTKLKTIHKLRNYYQLTLLKCLSKLRSHFQQQRQLQQHRHQFLNKLGAASR